MFKRTLQIRMTKPSKTADEVAADNDINLKVSFEPIGVDTIVHSVTTFAIVYLVLDTGRKVVTALVTN